MSSSLPVTDLFASDASKQTKCFYSWNAFDNPEGIDALSQSWDFTLAYAFTPVALLESGEEVGNIERHLHPDLFPVGSPDVASIASDVEGVGGSTTSLPGRPSDGSDDGQAPPILHNLRLVAWRICGGSTPSRTSQATPRISSRQGGAPRQKIDMKDPGKPSNATFVPPKFHSIKLV
jgi:hypothetical protein